MNDIYVIFWQLLACSVGGVGCGYLAGYLMAFREQVVLGWIVAGAGVALILLSAWWCLPG